MTTSLDPKTLTRVAKLICDIDGPCERRGYELEQLLRDAGWSNPPEYDGSSRVGWLTEALADRSKDHGDIARLLCRLCDPLEYDGGMQVAEAFRTELNRILEPERLMVSYVGGRPVLGELTDDPDQPMFSAPEGLENRLRALLPDPRVVMLLVDRVEQSRKAQASGAHLLALFGIGSFVEGLLFSVLLERYQRFASTAYSGQRISGQHRQPGPRLFRGSAPGRLLGLVKKVQRCIRATLRARDETLIAQKVRP